jgi:hypothetical protein
MRKGVAIITLFQQVESRMLKQLQFVGQLQRYRTNTKIEWSLLVGDMFDDRYSYAILRMRNHPRAMHHDQLDLFEGYNISMISICTTDPLRQEYLLSIFIHTSVIGPNGWPPSSILSITPLTVRLVDKRRKWRVNRLTH